MNARTNRLRNTTRPFEAFKLGFKISHKDLGDSSFLVSLPFLPFLLLIGCAQVFPKGHERLVLCRGSGFTDSEVAGISGV